MPSTFTTNKNLEIPAAGAYNDTWNVPADADLIAIDNAFGGVTAINVTGVGSGSYTLTLAQMQPPNIEFSGVMSGSLIYNVPQGGGIWSVWNNTSGAFALQFAFGPTASAVTIPQGTRALVICDGANMQYADTAQGAIAVANTLKSGVFTAVAGSGSVSFATEFNNACTAAVCQSESSAVTQIYVTGRTINAFQYVANGAGQCTYIATGN